MTDIKCKDGKKETLGDSRRRRARQKEAEKFAEENGLVLIKYDVSCNK